MRESDMRRHVVFALKELDAQAIENPINPGCPDVEFIGGWLELKYIPAYPKRRYISVVRVPHFLPIQRAWIRRRSRCGGRVFVLLRVEDDWFLVGGYLGANHIGVDWVRADLIRYSLGHWLGRLPTSAELITILADGANGHGSQTGHTTGNRVSEEMELERALASNGYSE